MHKVPRPVAHTLLVLLLLLGPVTLGNAQTKSIRKADQYYQTGGYMEAIPLYKEGLETVGKSELGEYLFRVGECYRRTGQYKQAGLWYKKAIMRDYREPKAHLYYAQSLLSVGKYQQAGEEFEAYAKLVPNDPLGPNGVKSAELAGVWAENPTGYQVSPVRVLNSKASDYSPMYGSKDYRTIFFTSTREEALGKASHAGTGEKFADIFVSMSDGHGSWSKPKLMSGAVNTEFEEGTPNVNNEFTQFYYTQCKATKRRRKREDKLGCQIFEATQTGQGFDDAKLIALAPDSIVVAHPAISPDGLKLYFTSDLPGGFGGLDIWVVTRTALGGEWSRPMNMGSAINTPGNECFPFVHADSSIYFSSNGHPGMGGLDIFRATKDRTGNLVVENMQSPINSPGDDFGITFQKEREEGFFSSNREGGRGKDDIYWFYLPPLEFNLIGQFKDDREEQPVPNAKVKLMGSDGSIQHAETNEKGEFKFILKPNTDYVAVGSSKGFLNNKLRVSTKGKTKSQDFRETVSMSWTGGGRSISLPNIFYDFGSYELRPESEAALSLLVEILNDNPQIVIELGSHTDGVGTLEYNYELSQKRAQSVVNYLIDHGVTPARLRAKGYAQTVPVVVDARLNAQHNFLPVGRPLTEDYITTLPDEAQQEAARQVNRRTAFRVISDQYGVDAADGTPTQPEGEKTKAPAKTKRSKRNNRR